MKTKEFNDFKSNLDIEEFKQYFYYHNRKDVCEHYNISHGNLSSLLKEYNIKVPKEIRNEKRKKTTLEKYGCENVFQNKDIKIKSKHTKLEKYGDENYCNHSKAIKTIETTIGLDVWNETKSKGHQKRSKKQVEEANEKRKLTCLHKYGYEFVNQVPELHNKALKNFKITIESRSDEERQIIHHNISNAVKEISRKRTTEDELLRIERMKHTRKLNKLKNGSVFDSKHEEIIYEVLCNIYGKDDVVYDYIDDRYKDPITNRKFHCDFYIKSLDKFIEYQGFYTHGNKPYDDNDEECVRLVEHWKSKGFDNCIYDYTVRDVTKRNVAIQNDLNFEYIYDLNRWLLDNKNGQNKEVRS